MCFSQRRFRKREREREREAEEEEEDEKKLNPFSQNFQPTKQGDLAKLGLAVLSMGYNVVILVQHYWTFAGRGAPESESEGGRTATTMPLLSDDDDDGERV